MQLFENSVKNALLQEEIKGGLIYVYHMTSPKSLDGGILKSGWERWFSGKNSNAYGPGIYTTLYPNNDIRSRTNKNKVVTDRFGDKVLKKGNSIGMDSSRSGIYGNIMVKSVATTLKGFVAFDKTMSRYLFGNTKYYEKYPKKPSSRNYYDIDEQLYMILGKKIYDSVKDTREFKIACYDKSRFVEAYISTRALNRLCQFYPEVNEKINGIITHSSSDGYVIIFRNFTAIKPIEYSKDNGKTWKKVKLDSKFSEYNSDNIDLRRYLGLDGITQYNNQTDRAVTSKSQLPKGWQWLYGNYDDDNRLDKLVRDKKPYDYLPAYLYGDFARVEKDGKYNYLYRGTLNTKKPISDVWFDEASLKWTKDGWTRVTIKGNTYLLNHDGNKFFVYTPRKEYICPLDQLNPETGLPNTSDFGGIDDDW